MNLPTFLQRALLVLAAAAAFTLAPVASAQTARLSTGAACMHQGATISTNGDISIVCAGDPLPPPQESCDLLIQRLYRDVLRQAPDAGGFAYWSNQCTSGAMTRAAIEAAFRSVAPPPPVPSAVIDLPWGVKISPMKPAGYVMAFAVPESPSGRAGVKFTQGQGTGFLPPCRTVYQVSKVPGVIDGSGVNTYVSTTVELNSYEIYTRERLEMGVTEAWARARGDVAWAPGPGWYINVQWTCQGPSAFPVQWDEASW